MDSKLLMIGDLLDLSNVPNDIIPCKVVELHADELYVIQPNDTACDVVGYDMINPIPLTEEILEKNGFEYMSDEQEEYYNDKCVPHIHLYVCQNNPLELDWDRNWVFIHYVHQLQHVLRLCGLNELADNFIV